MKVETVDRAPGVVGRELPNVLMVSICGWVIRRTYDDDDNELVSFKELKIYFNNFENDIL